MPSAACGCKLCRDLRGAANRTIQQTNQKEGYSQRNLLLGQACANGCFLALKKHNFSLELVE